jgi:putative sigma-54 modulation protein
VRRCEQRPFGADIPPDGDSMMQIVVRGKNVEVPKALQSAAEEKIAKIQRFLHDVSRVEVDFSELRNPRIADKELCEVTVHLKHHFVKARASAPEQEAALDLVIDKVEHQASRIKDKRISRSRPRRHDGRVAAPSGDEPGTPVDVALDSGDLDEYVDDVDDGGDAQIVKTKRFDVKPMVPEEAALQMDLLGHDFFLFTNAEDGRAAVIYRRRDGDLGLIEATG